MLLEHGFELENTSNKPQVIYMKLYAESAADQTDHLQMLLVAKTLRTAMTL